VTIPDIREAMHMQPFRPFNLRLTDGRSLLVPHPDFVAIAGLSVIVTSPQQDGSYSLIDVSLIVSLEYEAKPAGTKKNGEPQ
jgi:hypothetical protein